MNKYLVMVFLAIELTSCTTKDEQYYRSHPKELQQALKSCPAKKPAGTNCDALGQLGERLNTLAYQLQSGPQRFGGKILSLQVTIAQQEKKLKENSNASDVKAALAKNKEDLADYLAVVKWLESPES